MLLFIKSKLFDNIPPIEVERWNYTDTYLRSPEWRKRAEIIKALFANQCQTCPSDSNLETHHRTYDRVGHEHPADLIVLCQKCHNLIHDNNRPIEDVSPDEIPF